jgi:hypothetical protein
MAAGAETRGLPFAHAPSVPDPQLTCGQYGRDLINAKEESFYYPHNQYRGSPLESAGD